MSLCLAAGALTVSLMADRVTLAWMHSVEKIRWEETWAQEPGGLRLVEGRVKGSGAGMDPPPEAQLKDGWWRWVPDVPPLGEVVLRRSGATADWEVCPVAAKEWASATGSAAACRAMGDLVPADADPVRLIPCPGD